MLVGKIKDDFLKGVEKISIQKGCGIEQIQIKLTFGESEQNPIVYTLCMDWKPYAVSSYKEIMDKKFDLIGTEGLITPYLIQSMASNMQEMEAEPSEFSAYLQEFKGTIMVAFFKGVKFVKTLPIEQLF